MMWFSRYRLKRGWMVVLPTVPHPVLDSQSPICIPLMPSSMMLIVPTTMEGEGRIWATASLSRQLYCRASARRDSFRYRRNGGNGTDHSARDEGVVYAVAQHGR
jgi:hypothetical protein